MGKEKVLRESLVDIGLNSKKRLIAQPLQTVWKVEKIGSRK
jgi:hypothetical protein